MDDSEFMCDVYSMGMQILRYVCIDLYVKKQSTSILNIMYGKIKSFVKQMPNAKS
jgi:hypothetical protein